MIRHAAALGVLVAGTHRQTQPAQALERLAGRQLLSDKESAHTKTCHNPTQVTCPPPSRGEVDPLDHTPQQEHERKDMHAASKITGGQDYPTMCGRRVVAGQLTHAVYGFRCAGEQGARCVACQPEHAVVACVCTQRLRCHSTRRHKGKQRRLGALFAGPSCGGFKCVIRPGLAVCRRVRQAHPPAHLQAGRASAEGQMCRGCCQPPAHTHAMDQTVRCAARGSQRNNVDTCTHTPTGRPRDDTGCPSPMQGWAVCPTEAPKPPTT
jgi:hypothetical protein